MTPISELISVRHTDLYIQGVWRAASDGQRIEVNDPGMAEVIDTFASASVEDALASVGAAEPLSTAPDPDRSIEAGPDGAPGREYDDTPAGFGRIAATTARQVILQRLRDVEDELTFGEYAGREGDIVAGVIQQGKDPRTVLVDLGKLEAVLPPAEQVPGEVDQRSPGRAPGQRRRVLDGATDPAAPRPAEAPRDARDAAGRAPDAAAPAVQAPERKGLFARIFDSLVEARMQQAHREIARHIHVVPGGLPVECFKNEADHGHVKPRA